MQCLILLKLVWSVCVVQSPLAERAHQVVQSLADPERITEDDLGTVFRQRLGITRLRAVLTTLRDQFGTVESYAQVEKLGNYSGRFQLRTSKGFLMIMTLSLESRPPHRIAGLFFGPPAPAVRSFEELGQRLDQLPGTVSALVRRLAPEPTELLAVNPDQQLAIGSTFKLYVLAALAEQPDPWAKVVQLEQRLKSLPSGVMQDWPNGAPVTVHTLAVQMISISDNTATDHLIHWLGRDRIEQSLARFGHSNPSRTLPLLTTRELFTLKANANLLQRYLQADHRQRRQLLAELAGHELPAVYAVPTTPTAIDQVEWYASCADLCRLMDWLRTCRSERVLKILAINPGLPGIEHRFRYVGYKGGSEAGVLNMTWLLQTRSGAWYAASFTWNHAEADIDVVKLSGLAQAGLDLIAGSESDEPEGARGDERSAD